MTSDTFNLLEETWISARRRSGKDEWIRPSEIVSGYSEDPFVRFSAPRPDFNGGFYQFFIGLLNTACAPKTEREWRKWLENPPEVRELDQIFSQYRHAFNLFGTGPRFMQDFSPDESWEKKDIKSLLPGEPGEQTIRFNSDHFKHRSSEAAFSPAAAAIALFALQVGGPSGGRGHMTSLRGGGPLTTIILESDLWTTLWSNVMIATRPASESLPYSQPFPWLYPTRDSSKGAQITQLETDPCYVFWSMSRRINLCRKQPSGGCYIYGDERAAEIGLVATCPSGNNYNSSAWRHPLTPYRKKTGVTYPYNPSGSRLSYNLWLGLTLGGNIGKDAIAPAEIVSHAAARSRSQETRILCFGLDTDKAKVDGWREMEMPLVLLEESQRAAFIEVVGHLIEWADESEKVLSSKVSFALSLERKAEDLAITFWRSTEKAFFALVSKVVTQLRSSTLQAPGSIYEEWRSFIQKSCLSIFDSFCLSGNETALNPERIYGARRRLGFELSKRGKLAKKIFNFVSEEVLA